MNKEWSGCYTESMIVAKYTYSIKVDAKKVLTFSSGNDII